MRISDWSSDVCSSDLAAAGSEQGGEAEHDEARARGGKRKERLRHQISPLRLSAACPGGRRWLSSLFTASEIGRASCRERVCKYASISVVHVSLTKKQQCSRRHTALILYK